MRFTFSQSVQGIRFTVHAEGVRASGGSPLTPKAFANFSPGFERSENPGTGPLNFHKPWKGSSQGEPFQGSAPVLFVYPGLSLRSNPGLKLVNAFGVLAYAFGVFGYAFGVFGYAFGVFGYAFGVWLRVRRISRLGRIPNAFGV